MRDPSVREISWSPVLQAGAASRPSPTAVVATEHGGLSWTPFHGSSIPGNHGNLSLSILNCDGLRADAAEHEALADWQDQQANAMESRGNWQAAATARHLAEQERDLQDEANCEWCTRGCPGSATEPSCNQCPGYEPPFRGV